MTSAVGVTRQLARFAAEFPAERIPGEVFTVFKALILDTVCVMLAGTRQPVHRMVCNALAGALGEGSVGSVGGPKLSLSGAILLDGVAAADFEFEHVMAATHPASAAVPALLALAAERDLDGHALMTATIVAYELGARIGGACGSATEHERGFHNPGLNGTLAAAAGCARLLNCDADQCASAMGLAASSSAGLMAFLDDGAMTKRLHPARSAQLGLEAALLASAGVQGPRAVLESPHGFLQAFSPKPDFSGLVSGLGEAWRGHRMIVKLSPAHAYAQVWIAAVNAARDRGEAWNPNEIEAIQLKGPPESFPARHDQREATSLVAVQYSVPLCLAVAIARDLRNPLMMDDSVVVDPVISDLAKKIRFDPMPPGEEQRLGMTIADRRGMSDLQVGTYQGLPAAPEYERSINDKFVRTLDSLGLTDHIGALRRAVDDLGGPGTARRMRQVLLAAGTETL
jgi:2-methylcitrate dehydratase PrpD